MTRNGVPIEQHGLVSKVDPGISFSMSFLEWEAASAAGLDLWRWDTGGYPATFKAKVIAWYHMSGLVSTHTEDAKARASKSRS